MMRRMADADFMDVISLLHFVEVLGEPAISVRGYSASRFSAG
jgi:hypothetical protein